MPKARADGENRWPPSRMCLRAFRSRDTLWLYDYADLWLNQPLGCVLDYGCAAGEYLERLADRASERYGVDIDPEKIAVAAVRPGLMARTLRPGDPLPHPDGTFDTVVVLEVIEHVADERRTLKERARVLKPGGYLLLTTPHKGWLTFLDPGNFKCLLPGLHRFIHTRVLGRRDYYERRFGEDRRTRLGMYGDLHDARTPWHRHYSCHELRRMTPPELETVAWSAYYPGVSGLVVVAASHQGPDWRPPSTLAGPVGCSASTFEPPRNPGRRSTGCPLSSRTGAGGAARGVAGGCRVGRELTGAQAEDACRAGSAFSFVSPRSLRYTRVSSPLQKSR